MIRTYCWHKDILYKPFSNCTFKCVALRWDVVIGILRSIKRHIIFIYKSTCYLMLEWDSRPNKLRSCINFNVSFHRSQDFLKESYNFGLKMPSRKFVHFSFELKLLFDGVSRVKIELKRDFVISDKSFSWDLSGLSYRSLCWQLLQNPETKKK